jgi:hypothetical protein
VEHPTDVVGRFRQALAFALTLALVGANGALCAGWAATPEARMECCADADCPMHKGGTLDGSRSAHVLTQAEADACCAMSERKQSETSSPTALVVLAAPVLDAGVVLSPSLPARVLGESWRRDAPSVVPPVPRHILLSVFLL